MQLHNLTMSSSKLRLIRKPKLMSLEYQVRHRNKITQVRHIQLEHAESAMMRACCCKSKMEY